VGEEILPFKFLMCFKMILILSREQVEVSTEDVIDWLQFYNATYRRINGEDLTDLYDEFSFTINNYKSKKNDFINNINVIWFRRWHHFENIEKKIITEASGLDINNINSIGHHIKNEVGKLSDYFFSLFINKVWIDLPEYTKLNKLRVLNLAISSKLTIPKTIVTKNLNELREFYFENKQKIITKPISDVIYLSSGKNIYMMNTIRITDEMLNSCPLYFYPSLFQEEILKSYEIRSFYMFGQFYSMAIFSQKDNQTEVDFRNYNKDTPNRNVPYYLPKSIENKLLKLMKKLNLKHGSIDLIKSKNGKYYFLEVNPVGQFGMVSIPCNYYLEKLIAKKLIEYDK
jgi:ATP-GRASP peptide maturase of grasp-with-spasm system